MAADLPPFFGCIDFNRETRKALLACTLFN
jgi:hypothetical protein